MTRNISWALSNFVRQRFQGKIRYYPCYAQITPYFIQVVSQDNLEMDTKTDIAWALTYLSDHQESLNDLLQKPML
jgi:hypothetical protein